MNSEFEKQSRSIANASGFPLQIRVAHVAKGTSQWRVFVEEHPWRLNRNQNEGFIDLVIEDYPGTQNMVIECKRMRESAWVFLIPKCGPSPRSHACLWYTNPSRNSPNWDYFGWNNFQTDPASYESKFCAMSGQDHGRHNILEKTASELIQATEALAFQDKEIAEQHAFKGKTLDERRILGFSLTKIYVPVIVTTAELRVAFFDASSVSLAEGSLDDNATFETVPYIRFRKSFSSKSAYPEDALSLKDEYTANERTVFVVNAERFGEFLNQWEIERRL